MTDDSYAAEIAALFERHNLTIDASATNPLKAEFDRRGFTVEESDRVDLPEELSSSIKLIDQDGKIVAWGHGQDLRQAAIIAFKRFLEGKHERYL